MNGEPRTIVAWEILEDRYSLTARARAALADLVRAPLAHGPGRNVPDHYRELTARGLAFQSAIAITITARGEAVAERVG